MDPINRQLTFSRIRHAVPGESVITPDESLILQLGLIFPIIKMYGADIVHPYTPVGVVAALEAMQRTPPMLEDRVATLEAMQRTPPMYQHRL